MISKHPILVAFLTHFAHFYGKKEFFPKKYGPAMHHAQGQIWVSNTMPKF